MSTSENQKKASGGPDIVRSNTLTVEEESFTYIWKINNIDNHGLKLGQHLKSPSFTSAKNTNIQFIMVFYPAGEVALVPMASLHVHLFPVQTASTDLGLIQDVVAQVHVCIPSAITWFQRDQRSKLVKKNPKMVKRNGYIYHADFPRVLRIAELQDPACGFVLENVLTIMCEVTITLSHDYGTPRHVSEVHNNYFGVLLDNPMHYDFKLIVGDQVFPVHRCVIELQSTVFQAMFRNNWIEEKNNSVVITDMDPEVMQDLLRFMYTGTAPGMSQHADKLLIAADKYDVTALKVACQEEMACTLSADNVASVLALADLHGAEPLTRHAHDYILNHTSEVHLSPAYQKFLKDFPQIAVRLGLLDSEKRIPPVDDSEEKGDGDAERKSKRQKIE